MARKYPNEGNSAPSMGWRYLIWLAILFIVFWYWSQSYQPATTERISYTEFKTAVRQDKVDEILVKGDQISGAYKRPKDQGGVERTGKEEDRALKQPERFVTTLPSFEDPQLMPLLQEHQVEIKAESSQTPWWLDLLSTVLIWVIIFAIIIYAFRRVQERMINQGGGGGPFGFGRSKAERFTKDKVQVTFDDVAGLENAKRDLQEIIDFLKAPEHYRRLGAKPPRGLLLIGPPGTGKTLLAKAVAGEAEVAFFSISGSEFIEMFVGVGASRVRDMFSTAKKEAPAIIFIDEIDSVGRTRGAGVGGGHDEREQTLNQILSQMDGFSPHEDVVVMAATNRPDVLDPALLRPGRFDRKIVLESPRKEARLQMLKVHTRHVPLAEEVDLAAIAARTVGFSGADLENLVNEAALLAGRRDRQTVDMRAFNEARDKIILGAEREDLLNEEEKELVAYHEAGHALTAWLLPHADPLDKVTIMPRGRALGATEQVPEEDQLNLKFRYLLDRLAVMLGGWVSEKVVFGEVSSGAENDLKQATGLARRMICQWGMSERLGAAAFRRGEEHVFLGREMAQPPDFSEHTARLIDEEIMKLIGEREKKTEHLLTQHRAQLDSLARALIEQETLEADQIERILAKKKIAVS